MSTLRPVAVVGESVPLAQCHDRFRRCQHALGVEAHLVEERGIREREGLAVLVVEPSRERDAVTRHATGRRSRRRAATACA